MRDMTHKHPLPVVDAGIPMPVKRKDGRSNPKPNVKPPVVCPWIAFLQGLDVEDSFLVPLESIEFVKIRAKNAKVEIRWKYESQNYFMHRVWKVK